MTQAPVLLLAGPTASGKSAWALRWAEARRGEIVNADSQQLYADLRVLSARPDAAETARAPHHLYGVADAAEAWSVGRWLRMALPLLADIRARGRPAIVVGGTGLYFRALTVGLAEAPAIPAETAAEATADYDRLGEAMFRTRLAERDPEAVARIAPGDRRRLVRAWSVDAFTGRSLSDWRQETAAPLAPADWRGTVLQPERAAIYDRCDARVGRMVEDGALKEVRALLERGLPPELPCMRALGVRPFAAHLRGRLDLGAAMDQVRRDTRRYAKRQLTWFRNQTPDWPRLDPFSGAS